MKIRPYTLDVKSLSCTIDDIEADLDHLRGLAFAHGLLELLPRIYSRDHPLVAELKAVAEDLSYSSRRILEAFGEVCGDE